MKKYSIGLDIGTNSVGWAVINNKNFNVIRKGNKKLWGVRLFEEAKTAEQTRLFRGTRRRLDRRRQRIKLLQDIFKDEIYKIDKNFFIKMKESFYRNDDTNKTIKRSDNDITVIKEHYKKYPTIYHLRKALMESDKKEDIRLIYLALHHIIKNRGNFLYNFSNFKIDNLNIKSTLEEAFNMCLNSNMSFEDTVQIDYAKLEKACLITSKDDRKDKIIDCLSGVVSKNFLSEFIKLIAGNKFKVGRMFEIDSDEEISISFKTNDYDEKYTDLEKLLSDKIEILDTFKNIYDMLFLKGLFKDSNNLSISSVMVSKYKDHHDDLKYLKQCFYVDKKIYKEFFRDTVKKDCIYTQYIHNKLSYEDFIKKVKKIMKELGVKVEDQQLQRMDNGLFLPRISDTENGKYPYQLNKAELDAIIENQGKYYPFLLDKINDEYKIERLLTFRIPYYVGPLNTTTSKSGVSNKNAWLTKKQNVKITPYNFEEVVDIDKTAEDFILRMTSKCTYLLEEPALPKNSILYSRYTVFNELKQIKVNERRLDIDIINNIYKQLFLKYGTVSNQRLINYLRMTGSFPSDSLEITGYSAEKKFASSMKPYIDFFGKNGIFENTEYTEEDAEEIIRWITIFEDKNILERKVRENYPNLDDSHMKQILSKSYKSWGNLSKKLLTTKYYENKETCQKYSIMDLLMTTTQNFMQIINNKTYKFDKMIAEFNALEDDTKLDYSVVDSLATSPANKKGIYQALKIVKELVDYMGCEPSNIMIEMARNEGKKQRTIKRKDYLLNQYKLSKSQMPAYNNLIKQLKETDEKELLNEKLYLYFLQEGKSLYSGKTLFIDRLNEYEVDHIIPRTLIKDNSFDNKALVLKEENQNKAASFVLPSMYRTTEMKTWWEHLKKIKLLSEKKYHNLCRYKYSPKDIEGFINRQLVETRQITKHVANILKNYYKSSNIIYLHAGLSSSYREKFELYKFRDLNDYHHAHDAYLAATLGLYQKYIKHDIDIDKLKAMNKKLYDNGEYYKKKYGYVINSIEPENIIYDEKTGEVLVNSNDFIKNVNRNMYHFDMLVTKKVEIRSGEFYQQNMSKKGVKGAPLKKALSTDSYGGYSGVNPAYAAVVKVNKGGKEQQRMIGIPIYIDKQSKTNNNLKEQYIANLFGLKNEDTLEIVKDKIPFNAIFDWKGQICSLVGASDKVEVCNAKEFKIDKNNLRKWKYTLNKLLNNSKYKVDENKYNEELSEILIYIVDKIEKEYKLYENLLPEMKDKFKLNNINELTINEKEIIIKEMLNLLKFNSLCANLKKYDSNMSMAFGKKNGRIIDHVKIINFSITGIYSNTWEESNEF